MKRLISLDVLRGLTIVLMILVNNPGSYQGAWSELLHSPWDGATLADFVFPFFLFIVGASIYLVFSRSGFELNASLAWKIIKRSLLIFGIGYILGALWFTKPIADIRIMSALQRIAIVYCVASFLVLWLKKPNKIAVLTLILLLGYWALQHFTGSYLPTDNGIARLDAAILGESRMYRIMGQTIDPEGLVGSVSALCNALFGFLFARIITYNDKSGLYKVLIYGALLVVVGLIWSIILPLNKAMWSSSFVVVTSGACAMLWGLFHYVIDLKGKVLWSSFFRVFGTNAIFSYVLSRLLDSLFSLVSLSVADGGRVDIASFIYENLLSVHIPCWIASMAWGVLVVGITWALTYPLYRRKIYIKL